MHLLPTNFLTLKDITDFFSLLRSFSYHDLTLKLLIYLLYVSTAWLLLAIVFKLVILLRHLREPMTLLEITPPQETKIAAVSTAQLFNLVAELLNHNSFVDYILLRQVSSSFEIVSTKEKGIRYYVRIPAGLADSFSKSLRAYMPGIQIKETTDYLPEKFESRQSRLAEFKLSHHFSLPLLDQPDLKKHDPLAYLTGNMSQLQDNDLIALQIVLKSLNGLDQWSRKRKVDKIKTLIRLNRYNDWSNQLSGQATLTSFAGLLEGAAKIAVLPLMAAADFVTGQESKLPEKSKSAIVVTPAMKETEAAIKGKLSQPLFGVTIRALLVGDREGLKEREKGLRSSFSSFQHQGGQSITPSKNILLAFSKKIQFYLFKMRLGRLKLILSVSEVAALYHFPFTTNAENSDLNRVRNRELPAPLSLKNVHTEYDVVFGLNKYAGENIPIGLTLEQRQKHMYLIGKTGMGKTTLLKSAIYQDMLSGKGLAVFDPHGDLFRELLEIVPDNRRKDVVVFDPSDRDWPVGLNLLAPGVHFDNIDDEQEWICSSVLAVFAKITAKEYWGPRMEHILRNATLTALQTPNPNLFTLQRLLTDKDYQKKISAKLNDPVLRQFWTTEFALLGKMQLSSVTAPLTQRLGSFITTKMSRHILLQEQSTINLSEIMDEGKILLVNLSKGDLGEDMSFFFGVILTSIIWMAAYQRTKISEHKRRDFFLYVDEFQNFATPRFAEITSEGRKFHVSLIASHQNIAQVEDESILKIVAGNANTIVCLKASPDDEAFVLPFMASEIEKGDIVNLAPYCFFMKLTNELSENAFSGKTVPLETEQSPEISKTVRSYSREHYAKPRIEIEAYLDKLFGGKSGKPKTTDANKTTAKAEPKTMATKTQKEPTTPTETATELCQPADTGIETV